MPRAACSAIASTETLGACPAIPPVSPRQKSTNAFPSASQKCAPSARSTNTGWSPGHRVIQFIGTPNRSDAFASSASSLERGCRSRNRTSSRSIRSSRRDRSIVLTCISLPRSAESTRRYHRAMARARRLPWLLLALIALLPLLPGTARASVARATVASEASRPAWMTHLDAAIGDRPVSVAIGADGAVWYGHLGWVGRPPASNEKLLLSMALYDRYAPGKTIL